MMTIKELRRLYALYKSNPDICSFYMRNMDDYRRGIESAGHCSSPSNNVNESHESSADNPLLRYFESNNSGPGIWKWQHYFEAYHRHLAHLRGRPVNIVEIGVYSGGSLGMWKSYFGNNCKVYGIDIEPDCKCYEGDRVCIEIGDQSDRSFWRDFRKKVPAVDVLIDDGGHKPEQQMVTLEEMLPHLTAGGVYICEDIHKLHNPVVAFVSGFISELNRSVEEGAPGMIQKHVHSLHFYPYLMVIEKNLQARDRLYADKKGSEWQPFFDRDCRK